jgi:hypothetical protein
MAEEFLIHMNFPITAVGFQLDGQMGPVSIWLNNGAGSAIPLRDDAGFWGLTSDIQFSKILFKSTVSKTYVELFSPKYGEKGAPAIPEPTTFLLVGAALVAIQLRRRKKA